MAQSLVDLVAASKEVEQQVSWLKEFGGEPAQGSLNHALHVEQVVEKLHALRVRWEFELTKGSDALRIEQEQLRDDQESLESRRKDMENREAALRQDRGNLDFHKDEFAEWEQVIRGHVVDVLEGKLDRDREETSLRSLMGELKLSYQKGFDECGISSRETLNKLQTTNDAAEKLAASLQRELVLRDEIERLRLEVESRVSRSDFNQCSRAAAEFESKWSQEKLAFIEAEQRAESVAKAFDVQFERAERFLNELQAAKDGVPESSRGPDQLEEGLHTAADELQNALAPLRQQEAAIGPDLESNTGSGDLEAANPPGVVRDGLVRTPQNQSGKVRRLN